MITKMKDIKSRVHKLLLENKELRDDDNRLIANMYFQEVGGTEALSKMTAYDFLGLLAMGKFTNFESIRRVRAKLQEDFVELRGTSYNKRKDSGDKTSKEIKNL
jgi:hypothetical protein